ncbi:hypothetical protein BGX27_001255, partial [Mortierella sp. AM989]
IRARLCQLYHPPRHPLRHLHLSVLPTQTSTSKRKRVSFGRSLTLTDLGTPGCSSPSSNADECNIPNKAKPENLGSSVSSSLPSTDPSDTSYTTDQDLRLSTSRVYTWNYLEGSGRRDSHVDGPWIINEIEVGRDLMDFRDCIIQNNGGLTEPHEKLAVNFIFLIEGENQNGGLQAEIEDESWASLCKASMSRMEPLPREVVEEALQWVHFFAQDSSDVLRARLIASPPVDPSLWSILNLMMSNCRLGDRQPCNEDTYLKSRLGPFLDTYLNSIGYTTSCWTQSQNETRDADSDLLIPDFSTRSVAQKRELSMVLLEGKVATNKVIQIWDDRTKLGQEMKLALDSILMLLPKDDVCVVGVLVREPLIEFFVMKIYAEGTYVMRRFAVCHIPADSMNMLSIISMMEALQHVKEMVTKTVDAIRFVKVRPSTTPKVPLSWLRPSFKKPKLILVLDGE